MFWFNPFNKYSFELRRTRRNAAFVFKQHTINGVATTPDAALVDEQANHMVMIFDQMMVGHSQHRVISQFHPLYAGRGFTCTNTKCWQNTITGQIVAIDTDEELPDWQEPSGMNFRAPPIPLCGDLFVLPKRAIFILDKLLENNIRCQRTFIATKRWVQGADGNPHHSSAFVYYTKTEQLEGTADTWQPLMHHRRRSRDISRPRWYYCYEPNKGGK